MKRQKKISPLVAEMVAGMDAFCDALEGGERIEDRFTVRDVHLDLHIERYGPDDVKNIRHKLKASQALLARFLGVSVSTVRSWEQGTRSIPPMACRYLDDIVKYPEIWRDRIKVETPGKGRTSVKA
jgi:DNA-binding transcriptional regulator YiaG